MFCKIQSSISVALLGSLSCFENVTEEHECLAPCKSPGFSHHCSRTFHKMALQFTACQISPREVLVPEALGLAVAVLVDEVGCVHEDAQPPVKVHNEGLAVVHAPLGGQPWSMHHPLPTRRCLLHPLHAAHRKRRKHQQGFSRHP